MTAAPLAFAFTTQSPVQNMGFACTFGCFAAFLLRDPTWQTEPAKAICDFQPATLDRGGHRAGWSLLPQSQGCHLLLGLCALCGSGPCSSAVV